MSLIMAIMTEFPVALMVELMNCNPLDFHVSDLTTSPNPYMINSNLIAKSILRPKAQFNNSSVKLKLQTWAWHMQWFVRKKFTYNMYVTIHGV